jgi:hypothetical protein
MELLITTVVGVVVLAVLYLLLERNVTLYGRGEAKADVQQGVRVVFDEMATNLRAAGNGVPRCTPPACPAQALLYILYNGITVGGEPLVTGPNAVTFLGDIDGTAAELTGIVNTGETSVSVANASVDRRDYSVSLTGGPNTVVVSSTGLGGSPFGTWAFGRYTGPSGLQSTLPVTALITPSGAAATFTAGGGVSALEMVKYSLQGTSLVRRIGLYGGQATASAPTIYCTSPLTLGFCQAETLLDNVVGLTFTYFDPFNIQCGQAGAACTVPPTPPGDQGNIRRIRIRLQVRAGKGLPDTVHSVDVRLRTL